MTGFDDDVRALVGGGDVGPAIGEMRLRYVRSWGLDNSPMQMIAAKRADSSLRVLLYRSNATATDRPLYDFFVDPSINLEAVPQRSLCHVFGWLAPGRAVVVAVDSGLQLLSATPCRPVARGKRFGK